MSCPLSVCWVGIESINRYCESSYITLCNLMHTMRRNSSYVMTHIKIKINIKTEIKTKIKTEIKIKIKSKTKIKISCIINSYP